MKITKTKLMTNEARNSFLLLWFVGNSLKSKVFGNEDDALCYQTTLLNINE